MGNSAQNPYGFQPLTLRLDTKGRCCGRKPLLYKRKGHVFCPRCNACFDINTKQQLPNFGWLAVDGGFLPHGYIYPLGDLTPEYIKLLAIGGTRYLLTAEQRALAKKSWPKPQPFISMMVEIPFPGTQKK